MRRSPVIRPSVRIMTYVRLAAAPENLAASSLIPASSLVGFRNVSCPWPPAPCMETREPHATVVKTTLFHSSRRDACALIFRELQSTLPTVSPSTPVRGRSRTGASITASISSDGQTARGSDVHPFIYRWRRIYEWLSIACGSLLS